MRVKEVFIFWVMAFFKKVIVIPSFINLLKSATKIFLENNASEICIIEDWCAEFGLVSF